MSKIFSLDSSEVIIKIDGHKRTNNVNGIRLIFGTRDQECQYG